MASLAFRVASIPAAVPAVLKIIRAPRNHRLDAIDRRHRAAAGFKEPVQFREPLGVFFQRRVHYFRQRLAGQIILGGAKAAGDQQHVTTTCKLRHRLFDALLIVRHGGVRDNGHANGRQLLAQPGRVGVDGLAQDQFIADGKDDGFHGGRIRWGQEWFQLGDATGEGGYGVGKSLQLLGSWGH